MNNNDIIRRIRYMFDYGDDKMISLFKLANHKVSREELSNWLKKDKDESFVPIQDRELSIFLNGLIIDKRGKREGPQPEPEDPLTNNMILRKLKIAFNLKSDDILDLFASINKRIGKHELSAFFRRPDHKSYEPCMDQYLRYFLNALQSKHRNKFGKEFKKPE